jgi:hypothetical protein
METNQYIVWYAYRGHETEGGVSLEEPVCLQARSKAEALYKYMCYRAFKDKGEPYYKCLSDHMKSSYNEGGWGYNVKKLDITEYVPEEIYFKKYHDEGYSK